ncbi:adenosine receptor A2a-like [Montipora capricornis]|uniref:adenosine receptor A2a-like n=1 Tax=Montipora capricornis TaxID=246305 RepID=UPI0035F2126F
MAAVRGIVDYRNMTSKEALVQVWLNVDNAETIFTTVAVLATITFPITTFGNVLIVLSVWMDPLRKLRSSPSNFIIFSMAVADLLVGLVACPLAVFWGWALLYKYINAPFGLLKFFETLINVSVGHILLLSIDRFFAVVTPLQYRGKRFHKYSPSNEALDEHHAGIPHQMILLRERTVSKAIAIVISAFLLCFIPWFVVQMILYICFTCNLSLLMLVYSIPAAVMYANSAINPFLYAWRLPKYKETFKHILKKLRGCGRYETIAREATDYVQDTKL